MTKNNYSCGPYGDGSIAKVLSWCIRKLLDICEMNFEKSCKRHDHVWGPEYGGPNTRDDIEFMLNVYDEAKEQDSNWPWIYSSVGFVMVRITAFVYKAHLSALKMIKPIKSQFKKLKNNY